MKNNKRKKKKNLEDLRTYFLACEFKPYSELWSVLDGFAYDVKPAYILGSLGIINYDPEAYAIIDVHEHAQPLLGYICTITESTTLTLLDKIKGYNGPDSFNTHTKRLVRAYTDIDEGEDAWAYVLSDMVLDSFSSLEQVDYGLWSEDEQQVELLSKLEMGDDYEGDNYE